MEIFRLRHRTAVPRLRSQGHPPGRTALRLGPAPQLGGHHAAQDDRHLVGKRRITPFQILSHLRERAVPVFIEPGAHRLASSVEVDPLHVAVPHRPPPSSAPPPTPTTLDSAVHSTADASSLSLTDLVNPVHR